MTALDGHPPHRDAAPDRDKRFVPRRTLCPARTAIACIALALLLAGPAAQARHDDHAHASQSGAPRAAAPAPRVELGQGFPSPRTLDLAALQALPRTQVEAQDHGAAGTWQGPAFSDVLAAGGLEIETLRGAALADYLVITARDGYRVVFAVADFADAFGNKRALLADTRDGAPLGPEEGPLRLILPDEAKWGRWIRQVERIEIHRAPGGEARSR